MSRFVDLEAGEARASRKGPPASYMDLLADGEECDGSQPERVEIEDSDGEARDSTAEARERLRMDDCEVKTFGEVVPADKRKKNNRKWLITLNNVDDSDGDFRVKVQALVERGFATAKEWCYQFERGEERERLHAHIYLSLQKTFQVLCTSGS